eukprot:jgi/Ulvmu1/7717/UM039_0023.1
MLAQSGDTAPPSAAAEGRASGSRGPAAAAAAAAAAAVKTPKPPEAPFLSLYDNADAWDVAALVVGAVGAVANGATLPVFAFIFGEFIDALSAVDAVAQSKRAALHMLLLGVATLVATSLEIGLFKWSGARQVAQLRDRYMHALLHLDVAFHDSATTKPEEVICVLNRDCAAVEAAISHRVARALRTLSTFVLATAFAFQRSWEVAMVALALSPLVGGTTVLVAKAAQQAARKAHSTYAAAGALASQAIANIRTVVALQAEQRVLESFVGIVAAPRRFLSWGPAATAAAHSTVMAAEIVTYGLLLLYGASRVRDGDCSAGRVVQVAAAVVAAGMALAQPVPDAAHFTEGRRAAARLHAVLERAPPADVLNAGASLQKPLLGQVDIQDVSFAFPSRPASPVLQSFTLHLPASQMTALVGTTNCGKTTLLALLQRLYDPTGGRICVDGMDVRSLSLRWFRTQVGLISGDPVVFATSIRENIAMGNPSASDSEIAEAARAAGVAAYAQKLPERYRTLVGGGGMQLTAEQRQRIVIARVTLQNPRILLLDEATAPLEPDNERAVVAVQAALEKLSAGRTTLVVTDQLASIRNAHQIAVMQKGRIMEYGSHSELYSQQQSLYHTLMRGHEAASMASASGACPEISPAESRPSDRSNRRAAAAHKHAAAHTGPSAVSGLDEAPMMAAVPPLPAADCGGGAPSPIRNGYATPAPAEVKQVGAAAVAAAAVEGVVTRESTTDGGDSRSDSSRLRLGGHMGVLGPGMHRARRALRMQLALGQYTAHGGSDQLERAAARPTMQWWAQQRIMGSGNLMCGPWPLPQDNSQRSECVLSCGLMPRMLRVDDPGHLTADEENAAVGMRRLLGKSAPEWPWLLLGTLVSALAGAVRPLFALLLATSISLLEPTGSPASALRASMFFVALAASQLVLGTVQALTMDIVGSNIGERMRVMFLRAVLYMEVAWFDQDANAGRILTAHLASAAPAVRGAAGDKLATLTQVTVASAVGLGMALSVSWKMTLIVSAALLLVGFAVYVREVCTGADSANDDPLSDANEIAFEALDAIRTVHAFSLQPSMAAAITGALARPQLQLRYAALAAGLLCGVSQCAVCGLFGLSFWYGSMLVAAGELSLRDMLIVLFTVLLSSLATVDAYFTFPDVATGATAVARVFRVIDRTSKIDASRPRGFRPPADPQGEVEFRDVTLAYPTRAVGPMLRRFSLVAPSNKVTALIGERVSGTIAAMGLLERFYDIHAGAVLLDGVDLRDLDITWLRTLVGPPHLCMRLSVPEHSNLWIPGCAPLSASSPRVIHIPGCGPAYSNPRRHRSLYLPHSYLAWRSGAECRR